MLTYARAALAALLVALLAGPLQAREDAVPAAASTLVPFASDAGIARLSRATARADFAMLANQFEAQSNSAFCGPTTAAIVLNSVFGRSDGLPRDASRLRAEDRRHLPDRADLTVPRFTQENVIGQGAKTRAQVLGEPLTVGGKEIRDFGYQTRQFDQLLRAHGLSTRLVIVDEQRSDDEVRRDLVDNLQRPGDYVVVTYRRREAGQPGGGHISPLGAYDAESDSFLVLDVNPSAAGWVWMPASTLARAMRTFDTVENRGYILVGPPQR